MDIAEVIRQIGETISTTATVKNVYGNPVTTGQRVVLPVATVRFGFGGGGGGGDGQKDRPSRGGGGGGRVLAQPCGFVEVTPEGARFVYYRQREGLAAAVAIGFLAGFAIAWLQCRRSSNAGAESV
ncbi:MAG TPA: spore germination protein GerW family protein [Bryobacteraceae bacterium]